jgi:N utilization substance protein B
MYAYYQNNDKSIDTAEKELLFSLSKAYDLYNYMLLLMVSVSRHAYKQVEEKEKMNKIGHIDEMVSHRFADNQFTAQLEANKQLQEFVETKKKSWNNDIDYIKKLYADILQSEYYQEYMQMEEVTYADDREVWRKIYKNIIMKDERIDDILEEQSLYWNDDRDIVDTFVLKTIKKFSPENGANQELVPEYRDMEDQEYAIRLFRRTIMNDEYYRSLIGRCVKNWEFNRLAYMDVIIMQIAIAELLSFPQIPISVTINEYVEIAKWYSTPKSSGYVNGIIDSVAKMLKKENKLTKA